MKIMTDYHHGGLFGSLHLLAKRLGADLFRPIGYDWFDAGFWKVAEPYGNAQATINQYLAIDNRPYIPYVSLNGGHTISNDIYEIYDPENDITHKAITLETFKKMEFDYIIATHPSHEIWSHLLEYQPKAKFVMQLGNENQTTTAVNVLSSVWSYTPQSYQKVCYYHQEYPMDGMGWTEPPKDKQITNMVHIQPHPEIFERFQGKLPEFLFKTYGMGNRDGLPSTKQEMFSIMKSSTFGWHIKPADG